MLESLAKSPTDKAKGKELKVDSPKPSRNIVKQKTPRTSPLKRKKDSPSKIAMVKNDTPHESPMSKRR